MNTFAGVLLILTMLVGCQHKIIQSGNTLPAHYGFFMFSLAFNKCPADQYFPSQRKAVAGVSFEAGNFDGPYCHGFTKYGMSTRKGISYVETAPIYLRLETGAKPCSIYVAMPTDRMCTGQSLEKCTSYQIALSQLKLFLELHYADGEADITPQPTTMNVNGFAEHKDFAQWCAERISKKTDRTAHPIFQRHE